MVAAARAHVERVVHVWPTRAVPKAAPVEPFHVLVVGLRVVHVVHEDEAVDDRVARPHGLVRRQLLLLVANRRLLGRLSRRAHVVRYVDLPVVHELLTHRAGGGDVRLPAVGDELRVRNLLKRQGCFQGGGPGKLCAATSSRACCVQEVAIVEVTAALVVARAVGFAPKHDLIDLALEPKRGFLELWPRFGPNATGSPRSL
eukprot:scaffold76019_cov66-Phaeocystis_antarctica.AAC.11